MFHDFTWHFSRGEQVLTMLAKEIRNSVSSKATYSQEASALTVTSAGSEDQSNFAPAVFGAQGPALTAGSFAQPYGQPDEAEASGESDGVIEAPKPMKATLQRDRCSMASTTGGDPR